MSKKCNGSRKQAVKEYVDDLNLDVEALSEEARELYFLLGRIPEPQRSGIVGLMLRCLEGLPAK